MQSVVGLKNPKDAKLQAMLIYSGRRTSNPVAIFSRQVKTIHSPFVSIIQKPTLLAIRGDLDKNMLRLIGHWRYIYVAYYHEMRCVNLCP